MKIVNTIRFGHYSADVLFFAGFYKVRFDNVLWNSLYSTRKDAENEILAVARQYIGIEVE